MSNHPRPPADVLDTRKRIRHHVCGFDRLSLWLDHPAPVLPVAALEKHCGKVIINTNRAFRYHQLWQSCVTLFQPDRKALRLLQRAVRKGRYRSCPWYVEIALDCITATTQDAITVRDFHLRHMLVPHCRDEVTCFKKATFYYRRRTVRINDEQWRKAPHVPVLYADKKSKLLARTYKGQPCCHLEHRFFGADALSRIGIHCAGDFAEFSHAAFWRAHLTLARLPSKADIGRFLAPARTDCSGTALRKRADKFLAPYFLEGVQVLQNLRLSHPEITRILRPLQLADVLPDEPPGE